MLFVGNEVVVHVDDGFGSDGGTESVADRLDGARKNPLPIGSGEFDGPPGIAYVGGTRLRMMFIPASESGSCSCAARR